MAMYEKSGDFTGRQKEWIVRGARAAEAVNYGYAWFSANVLDVQFALQRAFQPEVSGRPEPLKERVQDELRQIGVFPKESVQRFDAWYKDKLTPGELRMAGLRRIPILGVVPGIYMAFVSKRDVLIHLADKGVYIENTEDYSRRQLKALVQLVSTGYDIEAVKSPALSPLEMRLAAQVYAGDKYAEVLGENLMDAGEVSMEKIREVRKNHYLRVVGDICSEVFDRNDFTAERMEPMVQETGFVDVGMEPVAGEESVHEDVEEMVDEDDFEVENGELGLFDDIDGLIADAKSACLAGHGAVQQKYDKSADFASK